MANDNWAERKIGDDCFVGDGIHAKIERQETGISYLTCRNFKDGKLDLSKVDYISENDFNRHCKDNSHAKIKPRYNDVVFSIIGSIGEPYLVKNGDHFGISSSVAILRPDPSFLFPKYLYYWIKGSIFQNAIYGIKGGVAQGYVSLEMIRSLPLKYPPLPTQRKIAAILSAYDDLIENNTRRIKIMEEMAQALYREWFVHFRFPGHEKVPMVDSPLGRIPEGWEVDELGNIVSEIIDYRGKTPKKLGGDWCEEGIITLSALNVKQGKLVNLDKAKRVDEKLYRKWMKSELMKGDILMTSEAPLGELYWLAEKRTYCLSQRLFSIRANKDRIQSAMLFYFLSSQVIQKEIKARATGTTVLGIRQSQLRNVPIIIPPQKIQERIASIFEDFLIAVNVLQMKNDKLRLTRDFLLPKLLSDEINVENLEIKVEEMNS